MSNIVQFNSAQVPAFAKGRELSDTAKALMGGGAGSSGKRISIKGGVFRLLHNGKEVANIEDRFLDVAIVKSAPKVARVFYGKSYDGDTVTQPDCWSADGEKPSADSRNAQASRCAECSKNIAGSGQGQSRACRYQQRVAVVLADSIEGDVLQLSLPATSIFGKEEGENRPLQAYARWLAAQNINPEEVITRMRFDTKSESPKLFFKPMRWLTEDEHNTVLEKAESEDAIKAVTMTVAKMDGAVTPAKLEGKPPTKAKPVVEEVEEEAPPPPPKAKKKAAEESEDEPEIRKEAPKKPAVEPKGSLKQMVDEWDDE